jgi:hypothetical protein
MIRMKEAALRAASPDFRCSVDRSGQVFVIGLASGVGIVIAGCAWVLSSGSIMVARRSAYLSEKAEISVHTGECPMGRATSRSVVAGLGGRRSSGLIGESSGVNDAKK